VNERSYSSNNKNSDLCRQRKVPSIWAWEIWAATKLQKPIFTQGVREEESTRTLRTASRSSNRRLCEGKKRTQFAEFSGDWQDSNSCSFRRCHKKLTCGLAKKAVEITRPCITF
jgi:hypothetical protein